MRLRPSFVGIIIGLYGVFGFFLGHHFGYSHGYKDAMYYVQEAYQGPDEMINCDDSKNKKTKGCIDYFKSMNEIHPLPHSRAKVEIANPPAIWETMSQDPLLLPTQLPSYEYVKEVNKRGHDVAIRQEGRHLYWTEVIDTTTPPHSVGIPNFVLSHTDVQRDIDETDKDWKDCNEFKSKYTEEQRIKILKENAKKEPHRVYAPCTDLNPHGDEMLWINAKPQLTDKSCPSIMHICTHSSSENSCREGYYPDCGVNTPGVYQQMPKGQDQ